jgi:hypothetical protein
MSQHGYGVVMDEQPLILFPAACLPADVNMCRSIAIYFKGREGLPGHLYVLLTNHCGTILPPMEADPLAASPHRSALEAGLR